LNEGCEHDSEEMTETHFIS